MEGSRSEQSRREAQHGQRHASFETESRAVSPHRCWTHENRETRCVLRIEFHLDLLTIDLRDLAFSKICTSVFEREYFVRPV